MANEKFWRCTNEAENHNGLQYADGLIVDPLPWNPSGSCSPGGIYFADDAHILEFLLSHSWVREVTIPPDARVYAEDRKFKADKVVLGPRVAIQDFLTQYIKDHHGIVGNVTVGVYGKFDAPALTTAGNVTVTVYGKFDAPNLKKVTNGK